MGVKTWCLSVPEAPLLPGSVPTAAALPLGWVEESEGRPVELQSRGCFQGPQAPPRPWLPEASCNSHDVAFGLEDVRGKCGLRGAGAGGGSEPGFSRGLEIRGGGSLMAGRGGWGGLEMAQIITNNPHNRTFSGSHRPEGGNSPLFPGPQTSRGWDAPGWVTWPGDRHTADVGPGGRVPRRSTEQ